MSETPTRPPRQARPPQQRTVANGAKGAKGAKDAAAEDAEVGKGGRFAGKKRLLIIGLVVLVAAGAAYFLVFAKKGEKADPAPVPGVVVPLESTSLNLAQGHYLRVGLALQMTEAAASGGHGGGEPDGSQAKDLVIATYSGKTVEALNNPKERDKLKKELKEKIAKAYHDEVMDIYFTEFVTQ